MLSVLRIQAAEVDLAATSPLRNAHGAIARALAGARLQPLGHRPLELPGGSAPDWWDAAFDGAEALLPNHGAAALEQLARPWRAYEARSPSGTRALKLLAPVRADSRDVLLLASLDVPVRNGRPTGFGTIALRCVEIADLDALRAELISLAEALTVPSLNAHDPDRAPPTAILVGTLSKAEQAAARADLWARGVRLETVLSEPARRPRPTAHALRTFQGDLVLIASARCGVGLGAVMSAGASHRTADLKEEDPELLRLEWNMWLDESGIDDPAVPAVDVASADDVPDEEKRTWSDVAAMIESLEDGDFVLTERARRQIRGSSDYHQPSRMGDALTGLAALARDWAARDGNVGGDFAAWAKEEHSMNLAMHDEDLVARKLDSFTYDGVSHSREPHVKVDDAVPFTECGRIYFARDADNQRFIVDHIGLHPYKRKDW